MPQSRQRVAYWRASGVVWVIYPESLVRVTTRLSTVPTAQLGAVLLIRNGWVSGSLIVV
jgi:hypothetical protein